MVRFQYQEIDFQLKSPEFGDTDTLEFTRINRRTRGNEIIVYRDTMWPSAQTLNMTFTLLDDVTKEKIFNLINRSIGKNIDFWDHEGFHWRGFITNPDMSVSDDSKNRKTVQLLFQGEKV